MWPWTGADWFDRKDSEKFRAVMLKLERIINSFLIQIPGCALRQKAIRFDS